MSSKTPLTLDMLRTAFHLPRELAAEQLQVTVNELKKSLKNLGVGRWPYRKIASLQALQQDLDHQIQAFQAFGSADGPAMSHVQDLQDMHAKISQDIAKIVEDPNVPLDESLHKLRLQNYKARFLGRHGMTSHLPVLKLPTAPSQTPGAKVSSPTIGTFPAAEQGVSKSDPAGSSQPLQVRAVKASHSSSSAAAARPCRSTSTGQAADSRNTVEPDAATAMAQAGNRPRRTASLLGPQEGTAYHLGAGLTSSSSLQLPQALLLKRSACELPAEAGAGSASQLGLARNSRSRTLSWATSAGLEAAPPSRTHSGTLGATLGNDQAGQAAGSAGTQVTFNVPGAAQLPSSGGSASGELGLWSSDSAGRSWAWAQHNAGGLPATHYHAQMSLATMPTLPEHEELQAAAPHTRAAASAPLYSESRPSSWRLQEHTALHHAQQQQGQQAWQGRAYHPPGPDRHLAGGSVSWGHTAVRPASAAAAELGGFLMEAYELQPVVDLPDMTSYADADRWQQEVQAAQARAAAQAQYRGQAPGAAGRQSAYSSSPATWTASGQEQQQQPPQAYQHWVIQHHNQQWQGQQASAQQGLHALHPQQPSTSLHSSQLRAQQQQQVCKIEDIEGRPGAGASGSWASHHCPAHTQEGTLPPPASQYLMQQQTRADTMWQGSQPLGSAPLLAGPPPTWPSWTVPDLEAHKLPMHTLRPPAPRQAPSLEPLPTPLEEVLDQMVVTQQPAGPTQGPYPPGPAGARHTAWAAGSSSAQQLGPPPGSSWSALGYAGLRQPPGSASAEQSRQLAHQELHPFHAATVTHQFASTGQLVSCNAAVIGGASSSHYPSSQQLLLSAPEAVAEQAAGPLPDAWAGSEGWGTMACPDARLAAWALPQAPPAPRPRAQASQGQRQPWSLQPKSGAPHSPGQLAARPAGGEQLGPGAWQPAAAAGPHAAHAQHWGQQWQQQLAGASSPLPAEPAYMEPAAGPGPTGPQPPAEGWVTGAEGQVGGQPARFLPAALPGELGNLSPATPANQPGQLQLAALGLSGGGEQGSGSGGRGGVEGCGREEYLDLSGLWD